MTNILAIIPARKGSKGIPNKNFKILSGNPLIFYTLKQAKKSKLITRTVVSTDSLQIKKIALDNLTEVPFLRPKSISGDTSASLDYIKHCISYFKNKENYIPDIVVLLQPTSPLRTSFDIDICIQKLIDGNYDSVVSVTRSSNKFNPDWQFKIDKTGLIKPFYKTSTWSNIKVRRQRLSNSYVRNGAIYVFNLNNINKFKNIYGKKVLSYIMPQNRSINLDTMDDWKLIESYFKRKND